MNLALHAAKSHINSLFCGFATPAIRFCKWLAFFCRAFAILLWSNLNCPHFRQVNTTLISVQCILRCCQSLSILSLPYLRELNVRGMSA